MSRDLPSISIITPSFNQASYLEQTLRSVLDQGYPRLEYIVVDGGSRDDSRRILEANAGRLAFWVSEPDRGQAHAINKGLARASGEIVGFLNSDDLYLPGALSSVSHHFASNPGWEWLCGDTVLFGRGEPSRLVEARVPRTVGHCLGWAYRAPQPGMFWKRRLLEGGFDERWRYCFDHELYVRLLLRGHGCEHVPVPLAAYRLHDESKTIAESVGFDQEFDAIAEIYEPRVPWPARRWSRATRMLRRSATAGRSGNHREAITLVLQAFLTHPEGIVRRPFWGCLRRALGVGPRRSADR